MTYESKGRKLTDYEREVIENLAEEAMEVGKIAMKVLRFGAGDLHPRTGLSNTIHLGREIGNMHHMVDLASSAGLISEVDINYGVDEKASRFLTYQQSEPPKTETLPVKEPIMTVSQATLRCIEIADKIESATGYGSWMSGLAIEHDDLVRKFKLDRKRLSSERLD